MPKNKKKNKQQPTQQQQQQQQQQQHNHDGECCHHKHTHAHNDQQFENPEHIQNTLAGFEQLTKKMGNPGNLMDSINMLPELTKMLSGLQGLGVGGQFKPDDPLPDFSKFDEAKTILEAQIDEFQKTVELVKKKDFTNIPKPVVPQQPQQKLTKEQQKVKDKNNQIIKSNIEYLDSLQKELKQLMKDPLLQDITEIIDSGIKNLQLDAQYYQKQLEV